MGRICVFFVYGERSGKKTFQIQLNSLRGKDPHVHIPDDTVNKTVVSLR